MVFLFSYFLGASYVSSENFSSSICDMGQDYKVTQGIGSASQKAWHKAGIQCTLAECERASQ